MAPSELPLFTLLFTLPLLLLLEKLWLEWSLLDEEPSEPFSLKLLIFD